MNRRNFFEVVAGFVAGIYTAFVPKVKAKGLYVADLMKAKTKLEEAEEKRVAASDLAYPSFIYRGFIFSVETFWLPDSILITLHPFFTVQGTQELVVSNDQFNQLKDKYVLCDGMIRDWEAKQIYTTSELRGC